MVIVAVIMFVLVLAEELIVDIKVTLLELLIVADVITEAVKLVNKPEGLDDVKLLDVFKKLVELDGDVVLPICVTGVEIDVVI
jgi:hypothetical protein